MDEPDEVSRLAKRIRSLDGSIQWLSIFVLWIGVCSTAAVGLAVYALFFRH
jgi:NADH:ubiquinone oxidoreductase subunit K